MRIAGASALVTGGASGLGLATVERLRGAGAEVVILDLPDSDGLAVAERLGAVFSPGDVTDSEAIGAAVALAADRAPLRIVVSCAGVAAAEKVLGREGVLPLDRFVRVLQINLVGTFNVVRLAADAMARTEPLDDGGRGVVVTTASVAAFEGQVGQAAYSASKGGVQAMTLPLAREFAAIGIRVNCIAPGIMQTPMMAGLPEKAQQSLAQQVPHPSRLGRPEEFAALVQHLAENDYLNGETIRLDGAIRMAPR